MDKILEFLNKDQLNYADFLAIYKRGTANVLFFNEYGILLHDKKSVIYFMSAANMDTAKQIIDLIPATKIISAHEDFYIPLLEEKFNLTLKLEVYQAVYFKNDPLSPPETDAKIMRLDNSYIDFIHENYKGVDDRNYIADRIEEGMYGAFIDEEIAGFVGTHDEGSMGLLLVFPKFRRRNIALALCTHMINEGLANRDVLYSQITKSNDISYAMHKRIGMEISDKLIYWLF